MTKQAGCRWLLLGLMVGAGCSGKKENTPFQSLEVALVSLDGTINEQAVATPGTTKGDGQRSGADGSFSFSGGDTTIFAAACPLDDTANDPYGTGQGSSFDPGQPPLPEGPSPTDITTPEPVDGGTVNPGSVISGVDCAARTLSVCQGSTCGDFSGPEVDLKIVDGAEWRQVVMTGNGKSGTAKLVLRYRERH